MGVASAADLRATVVRGEDAGVVHAPRLEAVVDWQGGPAALWLGHGETWTLVTAQATPPIRVGPVRPGDQVQLRRGDGILETAPVQVAWTPHDVAAWSGPGLRGAQVTALAPATKGVWAATRGGGMAFWDGSRWAHLDRRIRLGTDHVVDVALHEGVRWVVTADRVLTLDAEGQGASWQVGEALPEGALYAVMPVAVGAWVLSDAGILRLLDDGSVRVHPASGCRAFLTGLAAAPMAACDQVWSLPQLTPVTSMPADMQVAATVPSARGLWSATRDDGLWRFEHDSWRQHLVAWGPPLTDAARIGSDLAVATAGDGVLLVRPDSVRGVRRADGLPDATVTRLAPGAGEGRLWAGTHRGVALINAGGTATPLPLAPVPAGIPVTAVVADRRALALATSDGLAWLDGRRPRGWDNFAAAVVDPVALLSTGDGWWALTPTDLFRLDRQGGLARWSVEAQGRSLVRMANGVAVVTAEGLRAWVDGAALLSPIVRHPGLRSAAAGSTGLWLGTGNAVSFLGGATPQTWALEGVRAVHPAHPGAVVATASGVLWLTPGHDGVGPGWPDTGGIQALDLVDGVLWAVGDDGRVWHDTASGPVSQPLPEAQGVQVLHLQADTDGAWIATDQGLFRVPRMPDPEEG